MLIQIQEIIFKRIQIRDSIIGNLLSFGCFVPVTNIQLIQNLYQNLYKYSTDTKLVCERSLKVF